MSRPGERGSVVRELAKARRLGYAIGAFNAVNLETAQAVVAAAEDERSPVILAISENAARHGRLDTLAALAVSLRGQAAVPVLLHFDHAETPTSAARALELGFDSVMLELDEPYSDAALGTIRELVRLAEGHGAAVEIECDVVAKGARRGATRASPELVARLVRETGCSLVAVDLGTSHKQAVKNAVLDLDHLAAVAAATDAAVVLHGASSVPPAELSRAVALGLGKVNVGTELMRAFTAAVRRHLEDPDVYDLRHYLASGRSAVRESVRSIMRTLNSSGHADRGSA